MKPRWRRVCAAVLAAALAAPWVWWPAAGAVRAAGGAGAAGGAEASAARRGADALVPVVLVHGFTSGPEIWETGREGGLYADLIRRGYRPGETLFRVDYAADASADPWRLADRVAEAVAAAAERSPDGRVDIISHSSGALAARAYVEGGAPPGRVRTLVMIAPPNRGSFGADALRVAAFSRALAAAVSRALPAALAGAAAGVEPAPLAAAAEAGGATELDHVRALAERVWLPAMAWFVVQERLLPEEERPAARLSFVEWMRRQRPGMWRALLEGAPESRGPSPADPAWRGLSEAYERALALAVADEAVSLAQGLADARPPLPDVLGLGAAAAGGWADGDWRAAAWRALVAWLEEWAVKAGRALVRPALVAGARWTGAAAAERAWGVQAESPVLARLVTEEIGLPGDAQERVAANLALAAANARAARGAPTRATCYVTIAGQTWNVWGRFARVGGNDGFVEASAARLPAGPLDVSRAVGGVWAASHLALPGAPAVREAVLQSLDPFRAAHEVPAGRTVREPLVADRPTVLRVGAGRVGIETAAPAGWRPFLAWVAPDGRTARPLPMVQGRWQGDVPAGHLAVRLLPAGGPEGGGDGARTGAYGQLRVTWTAVAPEEAGGGRMGEPGPSEAAGRPASEADGGEDAHAGGSPPAGGDAEDGDPPAPPASESSLSEDPPLIRVVLHTRLTTAKQPRVTRHARWVWSFGDGEAAADDDPAHTTVDVRHAFAAPGTFTVTARSLAEDGRLIREQRWTVAVQQAGETLAFRAETIRPPVVRLALEGPRAWVAGRPAEFRLRWEISGGGFVERAEARADPGPRFRVLWARPGNDFTVRAALMLKMRYRFPDGSTFTAYDTYVTETLVDVYATSVVR
ncbi:MAG: hypothetical protein IMW98_10345 [Firmicutes bacterium]|nr:hypothetical protein [Bacillota bacterium]